MFYMRPTFKFAEPLAGSDDIKRLDSEGLVSIAKKANSGCINAKACIQRLVNSQILAEGNY